MAMDDNDIGFSAALPCFFRGEPPPRNLQGEKTYFPWGGRLLNPYQQERNFSE